MTPETIQPKEYLRREWLYQPPPGFYDEMMAADGTIRSHWLPLIESLRETGEAGFASRWQEGRRLIHENGTTYNVYNDPKNPERPWPVDPIPMVLAGAEWSEIEGAIIQRATLLNRILSDLHGPRRLVQQNLLPAELVFPNPAFLRPCCDFAASGDVYLHMYAADLARSRDGRWWVISDRTQAPSGAGYSLENRLVTARVLPDVFRAARVQRLRSFFQTYHEALRSLAPGRKENPRIVVLTPGPYNETYFEHAFLARYLGLTLVEGGDLTVRDDRVFLKTLGGLLPVDVIVRRQDASYCDPLELRPESMLGVPGLVQAVRSKTVTVANALGSGLIESSALMAFLPGLCRNLLDEELNMPSIATWWCGDEAAFAQAAEHLSNLVIKPAFPSSSAPPVFGARLSNAERQVLLEKMRIAPGEYVAQEQVALSTAPVWERGALTPRHLVLRVYAAASAGSYVVMPGGLTRITSSLDDLVVSMQSGGGSKDTWVVADSAPEPKDAAYLAALPAMPRLDISRATFDLPSRVADNLFWLGRYVERVEPAARVARAILPRLFLDSDPTALAGLQACRRVLAGLGFLRPKNPVDGDGVALLEQDVLGMIYGSESPTSLSASVHQVRRLAWLLRDRISADAWRILNQLDQQTSGTPPPEPLRITAAQALMDQVVSMLSAFSGLVMESMTRGDGWRFLDIGRRLERALQVVDLLRYGLGFECSVDGGQLEVILEIADSAITYRSRYLTSMQPDLVLDLLLSDEANPRAVAYQLARLREHVDHLPGSRSLIRRPAEARIALALLTSVQLAEIKECMNSTQSGRRTSLESLLNRLTGDLRLLSETLTRAYSYHTIASRQLAASENS